MIVLLQYFKKNNYTIFLGGYLIGSGVEYLVSLVGEKLLLPPMIALQGVGENAAINIQKERENGEFISKEELRKRTKISKTVIETLTNHGSLNNMSDENQLSLF